MVRVARCDRVFGLEFPLCLEFFGSLDTARILVQMSRMFILADMAVTANSSNHRRRLMGTFLAANHRRR